MTDSFQIAGLDVSAYTIPTDRPEADGTLSWDSTTIVVVQVRTLGGTGGLGFTYGHHCLTSLISGVLAPRVSGIDVRDIATAWQNMRSSIRNLGRPGLCSMAMAAVDLALWDAKARALDQPLHRVLGAGRDRVPVYGSGGFTTYSQADLTAQLGGWVDQGIPRVKMKIGLGAGEDLTRARKVRADLGDDVELYVDANGAYDRTTAGSLGRRLALEAGVGWFEEPVTSDDPRGLAALSAELPLEVTAGEYGYHLEYFRDLLGSVDVIQADVTRCGGITEWLRIAALADAMKVPLSGHCGQSAHVHAATVPAGLRHLEYFHDHARIDRILFDGVLEPVDGCLIPTTAPGNGLTLKESDAQHYRVA